MECKFVVQKLKDGQIISTKDYVNNSGHPGFGTWLKDSWKDMFNLIKNAIAAYFNSGAANYSEVYESVKNMLSNSGKSYFKKGSETFIEDKFSYDQIKVIFKAWSEDELKPNTCKLVSLPVGTGRLLSQKIKKKSYEATLILDTSKMKANRTYRFIGGAQDIGLVHDVATISQLDIFFINNEVSSNDLVKDYYLGWQHQQHWGFATLRLVDGSVFEIKGLAYKNYISLAKMLRCNVNLVYDRANAQIIMT